VFDLDFSRAESSALAFCSVSIHSVWGTESMTMPAPDCRNASLLFVKIDLMVIAKSHDPFAEK